MPSSSSQKSIRDPPTDPLFGLAPFASLSPVLRGQPPHILIISVPNRPFTSYFPLNISLYIRQKRGSDDPLAVDTRRGYGSGGRRATGPQPAGCSLPGNPPSPNFPLSFQLQ